MCCEQSKLLLHQDNVLFSLTYTYIQAFRVVFQKAIERSEANEDVRLRVSALIDTITYSVFLYTTRGLFEKDKLIFAAQMTFQASSYNVQFLRFNILAQDMKYLAELKCE